MGRWLKIVGLGSSWGVGRRWNRVLAWCYPTFVMSLGGDTLRAENDAGTSRISPSDKGRKNNERILF